MKIVDKSIIILTGLVVALTIPGFFGKKVEPPKTILKITSEPSGATIYRGRAEVGKTPFSFNPKPGHYLLRLELSEHRTEWLNLHLAKATTTEKHVKLFPVTASVLITSNPAGAKIIVNKELKGLTPLIIQNLKIGNYEAIIEKDGFESRPVNWKIIDGRPRQVAVNLISNIGKLIVESVPNSATVYLNDKLVGNTPFQADMEEGKYELKLTKSGYADISKTVIVPKSSELKEKLTLPILPGSIEINSNPPKAQVSINGKSHGSTPLIIAKLQPGSYDISVSMPNFDVQNRKVEIIPGQKIVVDFELSQNTSGIDMIVNPPGVEIYMNGQKIGVSEKAETGPLSKLISLRGLNAGTYTLMFAHRLAQPPQVERKVELIKGEILRLKPINMWVANAELKLEGASPMIGLLYSQDENNVLFSPEPGVRVEYNRKDVEYLRIFDKELNQNDKNTNQ